VAGLGHLRLDGVHAYDGHLRDADPAVRGARAREVEGRVEDVVASIGREGLRVGRIVVGGTPAFPCHARWSRPGVELSPGTCVFHDHGYATSFPDLPFVPAALVLTRVVSRRPGVGVTLDVGSKAVAADPKGDRVRLLGVPDAQLGPQSEEHLVVETAARLPVGTPLLAVPTHVCPTCALHREALVVSGGRVVERWEVAARDRVIGH
jgi:D-serine deaminase-like pyridoxal phosphate-dependent protein